MLIGRGEEKLCKSLYTLVELYANLHIVVDKTRVEMSKIDETL